MGALSKPGVCPEMGPDSKAEPDESERASERHLLFLVVPPWPHFEGGPFKLELFLQEEYPMAACKALLMTHVNHPNVGKLGRICLDTLKGESCHPGLLLTCLFCLQNVPCSECKHCKTSLLLRSPDYAGREYNSSGPVFHALSYHTEPATLKKKSSPALKSLTVLLSTQARVNCS